MLRDEKRARGDDEWGRYEWKYYRSVFVKESVVGWIEALMIFFFFDLAYPELFCTIEQ